MFRSQILAWVCGKTIDHQIWKAFVGATDLLGVQNISVSTSNMFDVIVVILFLWFIILCVLLFEISFMGKGNWTVGEERQPSLFISTTPTLRHKHWDIYISWIAIILHFLLSGLRSYLNHWMAENKLVAKKLKSVKQLVCTVRLKFGILLSKFWLK